MSIQVIRPGLCTTMQDAGRLGYQHLGVPVNGPMDALAHGVANLLVGNPTATATLEVTLQGPTLRIDSGCLLAIGGADLGAEINGVSLAPGRAVKVAAGSLLTFGKRIHGARAYIAVHGGYLLADVLGSTSTFRRGGFGGVEGRAHGVGVHGIDDEDVDLAGQQVLDIVVLLADIAVGVEEDQLVAALGRCSLGAVAQLYVEGRLQGDLAETDLQILGLGIQRQYRGRDSLCEGQHTNGFTGYL